MKSFPFKLFAAASFATVAIVGVAVAGNESGFKKYPNAAGDVVTPANCNLGLKVGYECHETTGVCVTADGIKCEQKCHDKNGKNTRSLAAIVAVSCVDEN